MIEDNLEYLDRLIELRKIDPNRLDEELDGRISRLCDVLEDELYDKITVTVNNNIIRREISREEISDSLENLTKRINLESHLH